MAKRSKRWRAARELVDPQAKYSLEDAIGLIRKTASARFDETVGIAVRLGVDPRHADQMIRGAVSLPHGTGKSVKVVVFAQGEAAKIATAAGADFVGADDLIAKIQSENWLDFDKAVATPDMMAKVGKLGRVLGPRGLMPNPKVGTVVTADRLHQTVRELKAGRIEFRVEKAGIIHAPVGKASFTDEQLRENIGMLLHTLIRLKPASAKGSYVRGAALGATMGVGVRLDVADLIRVSEAM